jgi:hypothetical protein
MVKRSRKKKTGGGLDLGATLRPEIAGILLLLVALLTLLSLIPVERGAAMDWWMDLLQMWFGWGVWLLPIGFAGVGLWLIFVGLGRELKIEREKPWGGLLLFLLGLALLHLIAGGDDAQVLAAEGGGGGYVGYGLSRLLVSSLGTPAAVLVLVTLSIVSLIVVLGMSLGEMWSSLSHAVRQLRDRVRLPSIRIPRLEKAAPISDQPGNKPPQAESVSGLTPTRPRGSVYPRIIGGEQTWHLPPIDEVLERSAGIPWRALAYRPRWWRSTRGRPSHSLVWSQATSKSAIATGG